MATIENIFEEMQRINTKLDNLPGVLEIAAGQIKVVVLGELSETLGLVQAGEFRVGNRQAPGDGFSGVRVGWPPFVYPGTSTNSSDEYNIAGVSNDVLQFGLRAEDGVGVFGAGQMTLDTFGISFQIEATDIFFRSMAWFTTDDTAGGGDSAELMGRLYFAAPRDDLELGILEYPDFPSTATAASDSGNYSGNIFMRIYSPDTALANGYAAMGLSQTGQGSVGLTASAMNWFVRASELNTTDTDETQSLIEAAHDGMTGFGNVSMLRKSGGAGGNQNHYRLDTAAIYLTAHSGPVTSDIDVPADAERFGLWVDTNGELRLTDTAGEAWYINKSTST